MLEALLTCDIGNLNVHVEVIKVYKSLHSRCCSFEARKLNLRCFAGCQCCQCCHGIFECKTSANRGRSSSVGDFKTVGVT